MKLLYTKRSPYARKVRIVALEKDIQLELIEEDLTKKSLMLIDKNPVGKIPALILDNGEYLVDSPVICEYLESLNSRVNLIPSNSKDRSPILHWQALADGLMDVTVALYMEKVRHPNDLNDQFIKAQEETIDRTLKFFDPKINELKKLNLASIAVASAIGYLNFRLGHLNPAGKYQNLMSWFDEFSKRPSMQATLPVN